MNVFVIGAAGGIGNRLAGLLTARGDTVTSMHRNPAQAETVRDAVVFSAGAHGTGMDKTTLIDGRGLEKAATAAARAGVSRFVLVSVFPDALRGNDTTEGFEHYVKVEKTADVFLAHTDLDWIIVRPGTLLDEPGTGRVAAGPAIEYGDVPRDDVAAFIDAALHEPALGRVIVEVTAGDTSIAHAIGRLVAGRSG